MKDTTIRVKEDVWKTLQKYKEIGDSMNDVLRRLTGMENNLTVLPLTSEEYGMVINYRKNHNPLLNLEENHKEIIETTVEDQLKRLAEKHNVPIELVRDQHRRAMKESHLREKGALAYIKQLYYSATPLRASEEG